jgi:hypothetical protein
MDKETLKRWRLVIPGIIILLFIIPGLTNSKEELLEIDKIIINLKWTDAIYLALVIVMGVVYYALNIRWLVWKPFNTQVQNNIKDKLLNVSQLSLTASDWYKIKYSRTLMTIFYYFVDNDESLKDKSKGVRFNGLIWSSFIDLTVLSGFTGFVYSFLSIFTTKTHFIYISSFMFLMCLVALGFSWLMTYRHIKLSNEQIEVIIQTKKAEIDEKLKEAIQNL